MPQTTTFTSQQYAGGATFALLPAIQAALAGGDATLSFFSTDLIGQALLVDTMSQGDEAWLDGIDESTGYPMKYIAYEGSPLAVTIKTEFDDTSTLPDPIPPGAQFGTTTVSFTNSDGTAGQTTLYAVQNGSLALGTSLLTATVFGKSAEALASGLSTVYSKCVTMCRGESAADLEAAMENVEEAVEDGGDEAAQDAAPIVLGTGVEEISASWLWAARGVSGGLAVGMLATSLALNMLEKSMTNYVRFYNLTEMDLVLSIASQTEGAPSIAPKEGNVPAMEVIRTDQTVGWLIARADYVFMNTNGFKGVQYQINAAATDELPDGFNFAVDIPADGDNSLAVAFSQDPGELQESLAASVVDSTGTYTLSIATNVLDGESPSPSTQRQGYYYEHLIVLQQKDLEPPSGGGDAS